MDEKLVYNLNKKLNMIKDEGPTCKFNGLCLKDYTCISCFKCCKLLKNGCLNLPLYGVSYMVDSSWLAMRFGVETLFNKKEMKQRKGFAFGSVGGAFLNILSVVSNLPLEVVCADNNSIFCQLIFGCFGTSKSPVLVYQLDPMLNLQLYHAPPPNVTGRLAVFQDNNHGRFDVLVVDLKEFVGDRLCAPLSIMSTLGCLRMMRSVVCDDGLLVIHVIPSDYINYTTLMFWALRKNVSRKVWKIGIDGDKDFIIVASMDLGFVTPEGGPMSKFVLEEM